MSDILFEVWRGRTLESVHRGRLAVIHDGRVVMRKGAIDAPTVMRSCAKPFQAIAVLESGARKEYGITDEELAVICGSHHGEEMHVRAAASILRKARLTPSHLRCGIHAPYSIDAHRKLLRTGRKPTVLHNNCSGKHAGMVAAARRMRAPLDTYLSPDHPVQRANRRTLARFAGVKESAIGLATDGCSAPTFILPLVSIARAFAKLGDPFGRDLDFEVPVAMMSHPQMVGHPCQELMGALPNEIVGKVGAEGVYGLTVVGQGIGLAVKVDDGASRPVLPVVVALLQRLGIFNAKKSARLDALIQGELKNRAGLVVGHTRVRLD